MRRPAWITPILLGALWAASLAAWPSLPATIPTHFPVDGRADHWASKSIQAWFGLPLAATAVVALIAGAAAWLGRRPEFLNIPDKARFLALPPARQLPVLGHVRTMLHAMAAQVVVLLGLVQLAVYRAARGDASPMIPLLALLIGVAAVPLVALLCLARIQSEIGRQLREQEAEPS